LKAIAKGFFRNHSKPHRKTPEVPRHFTKPSIANHHPFQLDKQIVKVVTTMAFFLE
jgi:hypothetical protein